MTMSSELKVKLLKGEEPRNDLERKQECFQRKEISADELVSFINNQTKEEGT